MAELPYTTEAGLQAATTQLCAWLGLRCWHDNDPRRNAAGLPDLIIVGRNGVLWRELKAVNGRLRKDQAAWGDDLTAAGQDWNVWRPRDLQSGLIKLELEAIR